MLETHLDKSSLVMVWAEQIMMRPRLVMGPPEAHTVCSRGNSDRAAIDMS